MRDYKPLVGLVALGDPREEVPWIEEEERMSKRLAEFLGKLSELRVVCREGVARGLKEAWEATAKLAREGCDLLLLYVPIWTFPSSTVAAARAALDAGLPMVVVYSDGVLSGVLASAGALKQVGLRHRMIYGGFDELRRQLIPLARACMAVNRLRGSVYGVFGGRALGMYTVVDDPIRWQRVFGVDVEHVDQLDLLREAERVSEEEVERYVEWVERSFGLVEYDGKVLTREKLRRQLRLYIALKRLIKRHGFDFCGIKCQPELSDHYVDACLAVALINDPYDADGPKEPIVCACEVDHDGALTMQVLKLVSGGKPTALMDVIKYDEKEGLLFLANCGGAATWLARRSKNPLENLREVHLRPQIQGKAGGAATQYVADEGAFTAARLYRVGDEYRMVVVRARSVKVPRERLRESMWPWPHVVLRLSREDFRKLIYCIGANHLHVTAGDYSRELAEFCELMEIGYVLIDALY